MYRKAVNNKTAGGILALVLTAGFTGVTVWLSQYEKMTLVITVVLVLFLLGIAFSMLGYRVRLTEMQEQFGDDLETSVDRCTEQAAGTYFFFSDCLVDLANARLYYYADIAHISGMEVKHAHHPGKPQRNHKYGAVVTLRMQDGKQYMLASFREGLASNSHTEEANYCRFCELMLKYRPETQKEEDTPCP